MKFVQFAVRDALKVTRIGVQRANNRVLDLSNALPNCSSLVDALNKYGPEALIDKVNSFEGDHEWGNDEIKLLAPITSPDKVACVGLNYRDHCEESGTPIPKEPLIFSKFPSCIIGPDDPIPYPKVSESLDWEVELAVVIGKPGKDIKPSEAKDYIFGFTVANDVSARDWQLKKNGGQWLLGKSMDGFCPIGPCVVTADEVGDPHNLNLSCSVNGILKQNSNTCQLVHGCYATVSFLSQFCTLLPGDLILTGTPPGVGAFAKPPQFLKVGDVVECQVQKIGTLCNRIS